MNISYTGYQSVNKFAKVAGCLQLILCKYLHKGIQAFEFAIDLSTLI